VAVDLTKNRKLDGWQKDILATACYQAALVQRDYGVGFPPALTPVTVAQFLLESSWGKLSMGVNNYFGMKAVGDEPFITKQTREYVNGEQEIVFARFRKFDSMAACFAAHAELIMHGKRLDQPTLVYAKALSFPNDPRAFADALTGIYATDPAYGAKLIATMEDRGLIPLLEVPT
jgi:flagellum-specific peptidoglycan hydrolase FlgJ